jgi:1,4-alpha-glucan branching enzyme
MKKFKNTLNKAEPVKAEPAKAAPTKAAPAKSTAAVAAKPEVPKAGRVSFELVRPEAKNVYVAGDFNDWKPERAPLAPAGNGRWVGDLAIKPGRHEYLFVVDGEWMPDPNARESVQNPFGGRNSILGVSG